MKLERPLKNLSGLKREVAGRRQVRTAAIVFSGALVVIIVLAVLALVRRNQAVGQRDLARSRQLAADATIQLAVDPELSILLARQAFEVGRTEEAEAVLRQSALDSRVRATLRCHEGLVWDALFSPDGQRVASASEDGTVRLSEREVCGPIEEVLELSEGRVTRELTSEEREIFLREPQRS